MITTKYIPIEVHHSIRLVEYYYIPLWYIYNIIVEEVPGIKKEYTLQIAVKAVNDSVRLDRITPILLIFRVYLYIIDSIASNTILTQ